MATSRRPRSCATSLSPLFPLQVLEAGDDLGELLVDRTLAQTMEGLTATADALNALMDAVQL
jgi:hypothetical protein